MNKEKTDKMKTKKEKFLKLAYSKFGLSANEEITFEQVFEIIDELESEKEYCRNESNGGCRCISPSQCPECRTKVFEVGNPEELNVCPCGSLKVLTTGGYVCGNPMCSKS